jgi:hypothetical protein
MPRTGNHNNNIRLRYNALQLMPQLPQDVNEARIVLCYCLKFLNEFVAAPEDATSAVIPLKCIQSDKEAG